MSRMVRKQVYIEARHEALLKRRAGELGVAESELIRRGIEEVCRRAAPLAADPEVWERENEWIRTNRMFDVPQTGRTWKRDELYDERLERHSS